MFIQVCQSSSSSILISNNKYIITKNFTFRAYLSFVTKILNFHKLDILKKNLQKNLILPQNIHMYLNFQKYLSYQWGTPYIANIPSTFVV